MCPNFTRTRLTDGFEEEKSFLSPWLEPQTVAEGIFEKVVRGESGFLVLPKTHAWLAMGVRGWPWWLQVGVVGRIKDVMRALGEKEMERLEREGEEREEMEKGKEEEVEVISDSLIELMDG